MRFDLNNVDLHVFVDSLIGVLEARDQYTSGHSYTVAEIAQKIAQQLSMDSSYVDYIHIAGHVHDIGKIGIPDGILLKSGRLSNEEYALMQQHSVIGYEILKSAPRLKHMSELVRHHHEREDGRGYPDGLKGDEIPFGASILAVADSFAAMTTTRTYRNSMPPDKAIREIEKCSGTQFNRDAAKAMSDMWHRDRSVFDEFICDGRMQHTKPYTSFVSLRES